MPAIFDVHRLTPTDSAYPEPLRSLLPQPPVIYAKGNISYNFNNCVGIIGTRKVSQYGKEVLAHIFNTLSDKLIVVSGFTRGVDYLAHTLSIEYGLATIAVLPCGINCVHSYTHRKLYDDILVNNGLILSEYPETTPAQKWTFVKRNRVVAALSSALVVVEAAVNSGSLITYRFAKEFGKKIFGVPGDIFSVQQSGICQILAEGATPVFSGSQINKFFNIETDKNSIKDSKLDSLKGVEKMLIDLLKTNPCTAEKMMQILQLSYPEILAYLTVLQLKKLVRQVGETYYAV